LTISPGRRLLAVLLGWIALAALSVALPWLRPALWMAGAALVAAATADLLRLLRLAPPGLKLLVPERLAIGRPDALVIEVDNSGASAIRADVFEELPYDLERSPVRSGGDHADLCDLRIEPGETRRLVVPVVPRVRGERPLGRLMALFDSPFGLFRRRVRSDAGRHASVYPDAGRYLRPEALAPRKVLAALGVKAARRRGEGLEFESLRDYVPGDDPRQIDRCASARRGRFVTRLHQHEHNHVLWIAVDRSRLMGSRFPSEGNIHATKLDAAIDASLGLAYTALSTGDRVGLIVFDREVQAIQAPRAGRAELGRLVEALRSLEAVRVEPDYGAGLEPLLRAHTKRSLVVVLTDFGESDRSAWLAPLVALGRRHQVLLVALRDPVFASLDSLDSGEASLYRRIVLDDLLRERETNLTVLRRAGLQPLDLVGGDVTASILNRYLALRDR